MNSMTNKSTFSELFLITPPIYSALLKVIKDRGQLKELQELNTKSLSSENNSNSIVSQVNPNTGLIEQSVQTLPSGEDSTVNKSRNEETTGTR